MQPGSEPSSDGEEPELAAGCSSEGEETAEAVQLAAALEAVAEELAALEPEAEGCAFNMLPSWAAKTGLGSQ